MLMKLDRRRFRALRVFFDPGRLRALTRRSEVGLSLAGAVVGIISGLAVTGMSYVSNELHQLVFGIADSERLSSSEIENKMLLLTAPSSAAPCSACCFSCWRNGARSRWSTRSRPMRCMAAACP